MRSLPVVFLHVLKTGGMTFRGILSGIYGSGFHVCDNPSIEPVAAALRRFACVEFHALPWNGDFALMHGELIRAGRMELLEGASVFTMFREPVDQFVSLYFHIVKKWSYVAPAFLANQVPFPRNLEEFTEFRWPFNNQLAFLTGNYRIGSNKDLQQEDLARAKGILCRLKAHAGLMDHFSQFLNVFEKVTGQKIPQGPIELRNRNFDRPAIEEIPARLKDRIRERSALDIELYEFARKLSAEDAARYGSAADYKFVTAGVHGTT